MNQPRKIRICRHHIVNQRADYVVTGKIPAGEIAGFKTAVLHDGLASIKLHRDNLRTRQRQICHCDGCRVNSRRQSFRPGQLQIQAGQTIRRQRTARSRHRKPRRHITERPTEHGGTGIGQRDRPVGGGERSADPAAGLKNHRRTDAERIRHGERVDQIGARRRAPTGAKIKAGHGRKI